MITKKTTFCKCFFENIFSVIAFSSNLAPTAAGIAIQTMCLKITMYSTENT